MLAVAPDGDDVAVMKQPVEDRCSNDRIAEDLAPFASRAAGGDEHGICRNCVLHIPFLNKKTCP